MSIDHYDIRIYNIGVANALSIKRREKATEKPLQALKFLEYVVVVEYVKSAGPL